MFLSASSPSWQIWPCYSKDIASCKRSCFPECRFQKNPSSSFKWSPKNLTLYCQYWKTLNHQDACRSDGIDVSHSNQCGYVFIRDSKCLSSKAAILPISGVHHQIKCINGCMLTLFKKFNLEILKYFFQIIYIQGLVLVLLLGKLFRKIFFGQLRTAEMEVKKRYSVQNSVSNYST